MYHIVYLTQNLKNNKIYVGVHSTWNLNDGYLGSGNNIKKAIKKYGVENFERIILHFCLEPEHAYEIEAIIVDKMFLQRTDTYNIAYGGTLGKGNKGIKRTQEFKDNLKIKMSRKFTAEHCSNISKSAKIRVKRDGMTHSLESRKKLSDKLKGKKPNNYGKPCSPQRREKLMTYFTNRKLFIVFLALDLLIKDLHQKNLY